MTLVALMTFVLLPAVAFAEPVAILKDHAALVEGIEAGTTIAWLWVDQRVDDYAPVVTHGTEITPDTDADGQVELEVPAGISPLSVWVAVDLGTGTVATASPEGFTPPSIAAPDALALLSQLPSSEYLQAPARIVRALVVRPGIGAWQALAGDGTTLDIDGEQDGTVTLDLAQLEPVGDSPSVPDAFATGDTVVLIDVETLGLFQSTVTDGPPEPGP